MPRKSIVEVLKNHLSESQAEQLARHVSPGIALEAHSVDDAELALGGSRLGGSPDLPPGFVWPTNQGRPLVFLAQLNLTDFRRFEAAQVLPDEGWLYFFYDAGAQPWGFDPADRAGWSVHFHPDSDAGALTRTKLPPTPADAVPPEFEQDQTTFRPSRLVPSSIDTLLDPEEVLKTIGVDADRVLDALDEESPEEDEGQHQLLGHPLVIQADMRLDCQLVSHGLYCGDETGYNDPRAEHLAAGAEDWRLLLQIDTDGEGPGWMWGDCGRLYFWIREQNLASRAFDQIWVHLQCY